MCMTLMLDGPHVLQSLVENCFSGVVLAGEKGLVLETWPDCDAPPKVEMDGVCFANGLNFLGGVANGQEKFWIFV